MVDSSKVMAALEKRYRAPAWALLEQVGNGTGAAANRWADAVALSLWPSRGIVLHGFEIKVYRNDWLRELHNPAKADAMASRCDYWWVVTGGPEVATAEEMPPAWGLLELTGRGLVTRKDAIRHEPPPLDRPLLAAILRRATERMVPRSAISGLLEDERKAGMEAGARQVNRTSHDAEQERDRLRQSIAEFEAASGVKLEQYRAGNIGRAVRSVLAVDAIRADFTLQDMEARLGHVLEAVREARKAATDPSTTHE